MPELIRIYGVTKEPGKQHKARERWVGTPPTLIRIVQLNPRPERALRIRYLGCFKAKGRSF
jgi:hypothetical protein